MEIKNKINTQTNFGMSMRFSKGARKYMKSNFDFNDYQKLMSIMKEQISNPNDIFIHLVETKPILPLRNTPIGVTFAASVDTKTFKTRFFQSPLTIIKKAADYATKLHSSAAKNNKKDLL